MKAVRVEYTVKPEYVETNKAIQEQQDLIEAQRSENADLRSQLQSIKSALHSAGIAID